MAPSMSSPLPYFALSIRDDQEKESKCAFLVVALCPCLVSFILLLIAISIVLIVKFHFFCHTPLHSFIFKKTLLISHFRLFSQLPILNFQVKYTFLIVPSPKSFGSVGDSGIESDYDDDVDEGGSGNKGINGKSCADPDEVDRICKVIDELYALDRNMEAVLDECMVQLSKPLGEKGVLTMDTFSIAIKAFAVGKKAIGIFDLMKKYKFRVDIDVVNLKFE